jgi:hypothetical protein
MDFWRQNNDFSMSCRNRDMTVAEWKPTALVAFAKRVHDHRRSGDRRVEKNAESGYRRAM